MKTVDHRGEPTLSRKGLFAVAGAIGLALAIIIVFITVLYISNRNAIDRLDEIQNPTPAQYREQLQKGIERCLNEPSCRELFPTLRRKSTPKPERRRDGTSSSTPPATTTSASRPTTTLPIPGSPSATPPSDPPSPPSRPDPAPDPDPAPIPPGGGGSPPSPAGPDRPIDLEAPLPVQVCTDTIGVNCG